MESLLRIAEELERRDDDAASALRELDELRAEVEETRVHATAVAAFLVAYPDALAARRDEEHAADESRMHAAGALAEAEAALAEAEKRGRDDARLAAARSAQHARDGLHDAELRVERAHAERDRLETQHTAQTTESAALEGRAGELGARLAAIPRAATEPPRPGLEGVLDWCSRARGALLVAHAGLDVERDNIAREASELAALRERLTS